MLCLSSFWCVYDALCRILIILLCYVRCCHFLICSLLNRHQICGIDFVRIKSADSIGTRNGSYKWHLSEFVCVVLVSLQLHVVLCSVVQFCRLNPAVFVFCHVSLCPFVLCCAPLCFVVSCCVILCFVMLLFVLLCYVVFCCVVVCPTVLCCVIVCSLCYIVFVVL